MSVLRTNQITDTATNVAANISGGTVSFNNTPTFAAGKDPFNSIIETFYYHDGAALEGSDQDLYRDWTKITTNPTANKNSGMTESSGVWTFPSTGIWLTNLHFSFYDTAANNAVGINLKYSSDSGANFTSVQAAFQNTRAVNAWGHINLNYAFNITNVSTERIVYRTSSDDNLYVQGGSGASATKVQFIKLCPSV